MFVIALAAEEVINNIDTDQISLALCLHVSIIYSAEDHPTLNHRRTRYIELKPTQHVLCMGAER